MPTSRDVGEHYAILRRMTPEPRSVGRARRSRSERAGALLVGIALVAGFLALRGLPAGAEIDTLIPCTVAVEPRDTMYSIAERRLGDGARWPEIAALNPEVSNPDVIHVGQLLRWCAETTPLAEVAVQVTAEPRPLTEAERWVEPGVRLTNLGLAECLYDVGFRERDLLVETVATAIGENAGMILRRGDLDRVGEIADSGETWGPSAGALQIRTLVERTGTADPRDLAAIEADYRHGCWAAWVISEQGTDLSPWTANRWWEDHALAAAEAVDIFLARR